MVDSAVNALYDFSKLSKPLRIIISLRIHAANEHIRRIQRKHNDHGKDVGIQVVVVQSHAVCRVHQRSLGVHRNVRSVNKLKKRLLT